MAAPFGNKFAQGLDNSGRPPKYTDSKVFYDRIVEYFEYVQGEIDETQEVTIGEEGIKAEDKEPVWIREPEPITVTGLALFLGFSSKGTLYEYAKKDEFSDSVKRALLFVEQKYEKMLANKSSTGAIFALKNMGWDDKSTVVKTNINPPKIDWTDEDEND